MSQDLGYIGYIYIYWICSNRVPGTLPIYSMNSESICYSHCRGRTSQEEHLHVGKKVGRFRDSPKVNKKIDWNGNDYSSSKCSKYMMCIYKILVLANTILSVSSLSVYWITLVRRNRYMLSMFSIHYLEVIYFQRWVDRKQMTAVLSLLDCFSAWQGTVQAPHEVSRLSWLPGSVLESDGFS